MLLAGPALLSLQAQNLPGGSISGNIQMNTQYYFEDEAIGTESVQEDVLYNGYMQLNYNKGNFSAGGRYEGYFNPLLGYPPRYEGQGIPYRYASYQTEDFEVTAGNFYEQFGSGMVFRSYWEPFLGVDNSVDGFMAKGNVLEGIYLKGLIGKQRFYFDRGPGLVRGADLEINFNQLSDSLLPNPMRLSLGGSVVSRYLADNNPELKLPENVASFAGRFDFGYKGFSLSGEYAYKANDPADYNRLYNQLHYNAGSGLVLNASYSRPNLGVTVSAKRLENMDFRSSRQADFALNELPINFLPPMTKQHTWRLQTLYLYATQPNGEMGAQADVYINVPRGSALGGKYGMNISLNYSRIHNLKRDTTGLANTLEYESSAMFEPGDQVYYEDFNVQVKKKFTRNFKATLAYIYMRNRLELQGIGDGLATIHTAILDATYEFSRRNNLRISAQHLYTGERQGQTGNEGSWMMLQAEFTIAPHWFFVVSDEWNYGNFNPDNRLHYYALRGGYKWSGTSITFGYARQRQGIICVGGVCRVLPASNGFQLAISSTF
jgi:hypothetical protein